MGTNLSTKTVSLPSSLKTLLVAKTDGRYGEGGQLLDVREVWTPPASVTRAQRADARAALVQLEKAEVARTDLERWLMTLGVLTAKQMTAADAKMRVAAYAPGLKDYPPECFTDETVYRVAKGMTWFPSYAELCAALDVVAEKHRTTVWRLKKIAEAPERDPVTEKPRTSRFSELTPEQQAEHERLMAPFRAASTRDPAGDQEPACRPMRSVVMRDGPDKAASESAA